MLRLKANKTSLYMLVATYAALPGIRRASFQKAFRSPDYWLKWYDEKTDGCYDAFLSACGGRPLLAITERDISGHCTARTVHTVPMNILRERGMIEEVADRGAH
ncbi:MAG: hypothetical protein PHD67_08750 [Oscillospiraceae bacterium]|nr:hypothetical protein [Oscillospiraceae bacterium]